MTICEFCITTLFTEPRWQPNRKNHHVDAATWLESIDRCTICSSILEGIRDILIKHMENDVTQLLDTYLRLEPVLDAGVLQLLERSDALPIYSVTLNESVARDQFVLIFRPVEENVRKINVATPFGTIEDFALPARSFQVFSTIYDKTEIPRLSNETFFDVERNSKNQRTLDQIEGWLRDCDNEHKSCTHFAKRPLEKAFIPTRLVKVGEIGEGSVRLVETGQKDEFHRYATLSHCWGGFITVQTSKTNYEKHKESISLGGNFPRNFLDAINLCRTLKIKYIWIDSICIIQGSLDDWKKEAPLMHEVYGASYLNIAATSARNSTEGLFRKRRINLLSPSTVPCNWQGRRRQCKVIREDFWSGELLGEPLYKRAWVAQERMLSPRTINFGRKQIFWQCLTITACETMPQGIPAVVRDNGREELQWRRLLQQSRAGQAKKGKEGGEVSTDDKINLQLVWRDAVKNYTSCNITKTTDKLPAVAGLAQVMHQTCREEYAAGLWNTGDQLVLQMAWRVINCKNVEGRPSRRQKKDEYRAPTWAWPSVVDGIIEIPRRIRVDQNTTVCLDLLNKPPHLIYPDENAPNAKFMMLDGGWVDAKGWAYTVKFYDAHDTETPCWYWDVKLEEDEEQPWVFMYPDEPIHVHHTNGESNGEVSDSREFKIIPLFYTKEDDEDNYSGRALVVEDEMEPGIFELPKMYRLPEYLGAMFTRIGLVEFRKVPKSLWQRFTARPYTPLEREYAQVSRGEDGRIGMSLV